MKVVSLFGWNGRIVNLGFSKGRLGYRIVRFSGETISVQFNSCLNEICFNLPVVLRNQLIN